MSIGHVVRRRAPALRGLAFIALLVSTIYAAGPFWVSHDSADAQTTVNFVTNLTGGTDGIPQPLVGNIPDNLNTGTMVEKADQQASIAFTTGSGPMQYTITEVDAMLLLEMDVSPYSPVLTLHEDASGNPVDTVLLTFTNPFPTPLVVSRVADWTFTATNGYQVDPNTTYHLRFRDAVASADTIQYYSIIALEEGTEVSSIGWTIADQARTRTGSGGTWANVTNNRVIRVGIKGTVATPGVTVVANPSNGQNRDLLIDEGLSETYTVVLDAAPTGEVTITPTAPAGFSVSPASLSFTDTNWNVAQTFTVTAEHDDDLEAHPGGEITHAVTGYGTVTNADSVGVQSEDDDDPHITVTPTTLAVNEEMTATYTVVLDFQPADNVTVTPSVTANKGLTLDPTSLTFTTSDWETPQEVTVTAADDTNRANESATITHTAAESGSGTEYDLDASYTDDITVTVNDNDVITLSVTSLTIAEGSSGSYTVVLAQAPSSTVTVTLTLSANSSVTVDTDPNTSGDQLTLSFTSLNWSTTQTVDVTAPQDDDGFSNTGTITHTVSGGGLRGSANLSTTVTDDEKVELVVGGNAMYFPMMGFYGMTVTEGTDSGANNQFTVKLASQPYPSNDNVTFTLDAPAGSGLTFKKVGEATGSAMLSLTFTGDNWNTAQTVTVGAGHDDDTSDATHIITFGLSGANYLSSGNTFDFEITDDDSAGLDISDSVIEIDETDAVATATYTVKLLTKPSAAVTVTLTSPSNTDVTVDTDTVTSGDQLTLDFTPTNWNTAQTVTVKVAADNTADDESATIGHTTSQTLGTEMEYASVTGDVSVNVGDDEEATIPAPPASFNMTENADGTVTGPTTYQLKLDTPPTSPVTITMTAEAVTPARVVGESWTNPDISVTNTVVLNDMNYSAGEVVTITLTADDDAEGDVARITYEVAQSGGAMEYDGKTISATTVTIADAEQATVQFRESGGSTWLSENAPLEMDDGGSLTINIRLSHRPRGDVTVNVTFPTGSGLSTTTTLPFSFLSDAWSSSQLQNLELAHTADDDSYSQTYTLDFSVTGYGKGTVADQNVTVNDKDEVGWKGYPGYVDGFNDNPAEGTVNESGGRFQYTVVPLSRPSTPDGSGARVRLIIREDDSTKINHFFSEDFFKPLEPGNYTAGLRVSVTAKPDDDGVDDVVVLRHQINSGGSGARGDYHDSQIPDVTITVVDKDTPEVLFENVTANALTIAELANDTAASRTFKVKLATEPTDTVTVTIVDPTDNSDITTTPETLEFNSTNWRDGQDVTVRVAHDDDTFDDTATITFTTTQAGDGVPGTADPHDEYEGLSVSDITVSVTDPDRSRAVLTSSGSPITAVTVLEESTSEYGVALSHQPASGDTLTVTLTVSGSGTQVTVAPSPLTFNNSNWDTAQTVTVTGVADTNLIADSFTVAHAVTGTRAQPTATNLSVTRQDNDSPNLDLGGVSALTIDENASTSYDIKLTQQPSANVTLTVTAAGNADVRFSTDSCTTLTTTGELTFTSTNWDSNQSLTVCGAQDYDAQNDTATLTYSASGGGYGSLNYPATAVTVDDDDEETISISETALTITEVDGGVGTATYNVSLSAAPSGGNVTVTIEVPNNSDVTTNPTVLTFRPSDWDSSISLSTPTVTKSVEVRAADDDDAGDDTADINHTLSGTSYGTGAALPGIVVTVTDTDTRGVTITADDPFEFDEGSSKTYTVVLDTEPTGPVAVAIEDAVTTDEIRPNQTELQFGIDDWDTTQTVTISAEADDDANDDAATIEHTVSGADYGAESVTADPVQVTVKDLNTRGVILRIGETGPENPASPAFSIGEGAEQRDYFIKLATKPVNADNSDGEVTITVTPSDTAELVILDLDLGVVLTTLDVEFDASNWDEFQKVTISAPQEDGDTSQDIHTIMHTVTGADYGTNNVTADDITVTVNDDDDPSFSTSSESLNITEGTSGAYTVVLDSIPVGGDVTITVTVGANPDIRLVDADNNDVTSLDLEFTSTTWNTAQTVTVRVAEDRDALVDTGTIRHVASGANFETGVPPITMRIEVQETTLAGVTIEPTMLTITEGLTGAYEVTLQSEPQSNVTVVLSSSNPSKASISPTRLTFTNSTWDDPQAITVTGVRDADASNESATISHVSSGDIYIDVVIDSVSVTVIEDGTAIRDDSSFLRSSSCEGEVRLTWNSPTAEGVAVASYRIQWRAGKAQYSTSMSVNAMSDATSYTLTSLSNGVSYTIRVLGLDDMNEAVWSRETTALPSAQSCIRNVRFGNILADSAPVIIDLDDPDPGTMVNMRYRSLNPGVWSDVQSKAVERNQPSVTFDIRSLRPDSDYEVQTWLGSSRPPADNQPESAPRAVAQTIFRTTSLPDGVTFFGGGGGSVARIGHIEPSILSVKLSAGDEVSLSVEVWGRQGLLDNGLADKAPSDGRPEIVWSSSGDGTFAEGRVRAEWRDGVANDREVTFVAPDEPGTVTVTASLADSAECLAQQEDETPEDHEVRCSAEIEVTVVRRATAPIIETAPVNPAGVIPVTLSDDDGVAYAVLTPVEGGSFVGDGYSLEAGAGAVSNGEYIGVSMVPAGEASNVGMTWHRYTLGGLRYAISVVDADGEAVSDYALSDAATTCVPLPPELRGSIADIVLAVTEDGGGMTVLSTSVKITPDGVSVCGKLSTLPATVAAGKVGSPPEVVDPSEDDVAESPLPDTGGESPSRHWILWLLLAGAVAAVAGGRLLAPFAKRRGIEVEAGFKPHLPAGDTHPLRRGRSTDIPEPAGTYPQTRRMDDR